MAAKSQKAFLKWLDRGPAEKRFLADEVIASVVPIFLQAGFVWVDVCFDIGRPQVNEIPLERRHGDGTVDFVSILFNKYRAASFDIRGGTKRPDGSGGWDWVKAAALVWKQDDGFRFRRWSRKWWEFNRQAAEKRVAERVAGLSPQLVAYLNGNEAGPNVRVSKIGADNTKASEAN